MKLMRPFGLLLLALVLDLAGVPFLHADVGNRGAWGDQGDGTFKNPVLPGDYSDLDAIRVGADYYAISSTFQYSPGVVILHSRDLVNWTILGHVADDLTRIGPELNWDRMDRYGRGIWAGAIRYHAGKFWVYFGTPEEGFFMSTATNAAGPWTPLHPLHRTNGWDDCCPFWDDDGQGYFVATQFSADAIGTKYNIHLFKLSPDGREILPGSDKIIHQSKGSEANKLYKINGTYYHFFSEVKPEGRVAMMERSQNIYGPYEVQQLNHVARVDREPNQGGLIQTEAGGWWFFTHQGAGGFWEGRTACLLPVTWTNGWPVIGALGADGIGTMVWSATKPVTGQLVTVPQTDDEFSAPVIAPQWEWNYRPRADKWSLTERPGFLRLYAFKPLAADNLLKAGNTLTQRVMGYGGGEVVTKLDVTGMADGQTAGLCFFWSKSCQLGVRQISGTRRVELDDNGLLTAGPELKPDTQAVWFKASIDDHGGSVFAFSLDGKNFTPLGGRFQFGWGNYRGTRVGIYSYNAEAERGHVDVDFFHYHYPGPQNHYSLEP